MSPPTIPATVAALLASTAETHGDTTAVVDGDVSLTYRALADQSEGFGAALVDAGIEPGDRVAIWAPNGWRWIVAVLGLFQTGATLVPINTRFKGHEAGEILRRSGARVLLTVTDFLGTNYLDLLDQAEVSLADLTATIRLEGDLPVGTDAGRDEVRRRSAALTGDDPSDILFTSGTTGTPKGVVQTHGRTLRVATDWVAMTGLTAGDKYLMVNPYFHMFGLKAGILACVAAGATMLPEVTFDAERALARVADEGITVLPGAPTLYQTILDHPTRGGHDLSSLRVAVTGAADIPVELIRRIFAELPFRLVISGYGLTEGGTATATGPDDDPEAIATTVGRPRPGFELRIVNGDHDAQPGEPGEILLRGGSVMSHYLDDPEATAAALDADGWLGTGDLGVIDDRGYLRIVGRAKDMFIVGGFNAYPAEIENALLRHPDIRQAAVIGIPDERLGEVGMAFVVTRSDDRSDEAADEIIAWSRDQMANYKVPRVVEVIDELPLNATGKVAKNDLRARALKEPT
jgi:acyl-CoA synthetase (AMP-forming)/AMP-acid ligase II